MIRLLITALAGVALSGILGRLLLPVLHALKAGASILEIGPNWHKSKTGTPIMGGLMFILAVVLCLLGNLFFMEDHAVLLVLALSLAFGIIGFVDDCTKVRKAHNQGLTSSQKALLQMAVCAVFLFVMYKTGNMASELYVPFFQVSLPIHPVLYIVFAMFVMVGTVNAVNLTDGVDGLCGSVTAPVMVFFAAAAVWKEQYDLALFPAALAGGLIAYLFYNWHPAKVFMGDTGSLFLGGAVCSMAFALEMPLILILVGLIYICETLSVILQVSYFKLTHGKRLFKMSPIHHHFELCGWKEVKIVLIFAGVTAIMCAVAWLGITA